MEKAELARKIDCQNRSTKMTRNEFVALCGKYLIGVDIALENEHIIAALKAKNAREVDRILQEEF